jgi:DNA repair exonuclease SbcCD ATPase subunit
LLRKRTEDLGTVEDERAGLHAQWVELDALKRELAERVRAVSERERELQAALAQVRRDGGTGVAGVAVVAGASAAPPGDLERRAAALAERERRVAAREQALAQGGAAPSPLPPPLAPDEQRLAEIESRLAALKEAEQAFVRTQQELAARSEALTARERLVSQRERELDDREDVADAKPEVAELEERLRRLEQQRTPPPALQPAVDDTQGFSGGLKRLEQQGTRRQPG